MAGERSTAGTLITTTERRRLVAAFAFLGLIACGSAGAEAATDQTTRGETLAGSPDSAIAVAVHVAREPNGSKLSFDLSRPATVRSMTLENPDRIVIETSDIAFQVAPEAGRLASASGVIWLGSVRPAPPTIMAMTWRNVVPAVSRVPT